MANKKKSPRISETEWEIMRILWRKHPIPASEVFAQLAAKDSSWHPKTVKTLLARLTRKGALSFTVQGRSYLYQPQVGEDDYIAMASTSFLDRVFDGALQPMLAHFVESRRLTRKDLNELEKLLDRESSKGGKR